MVPSPGILKRRGNSEAPVFCCSVAEGRGGGGTRRSLFDGSLSECFLRRWKVRPLCDIELRRLRTALGRGGQRGIVRPRAAGIWAVPARRINPSSRGGWGRRTKGLPLPFLVGAALCTGLVIRRRSLGLTELVCCGATVCFYSPARQTGLLARGVAGGGAVGLERALPAKKKKKKKPAKKCPIAQAAIGRWSLGSRGWMMERSPEI